MTSGRARCTLWGKAIAILAKDIRLELRSRYAINAILMPGRRIGVYSCVGPGVVLYEDVPDRTAVFVKQELETRPWGPERYGW